MLDYLSLFEDYGIDYATEGPNVGNNYIGVMCPCVVILHTTAVSLRTVSTNLLAGDAVVIHWSHPVKNNWTEGHPINFE
jgi:hypothetical protein